MSLFENETYRWRDTFFVMFEMKNRPNVEKVKQLLMKLGPHYELKDLRADAGARFESVSLISPDDYAAMDITYIEGEEVTERNDELVEELKSCVETEIERKKMKYIRQCTARLDVFHFEQLVNNFTSEDDEDFLDPGSLLLVLDHLALLCKGVAVDPQSGIIM